jgi:hypothetical protein
LPVRGEEAAEGGYRQHDRRGAHARVRREGGQPASDHRRGHDRGAQQAHGGRVDRSGSRQRHLHHRYKSADQDERQRQRKRCAAVPVRGPALDLGDEKRQHQSGRADDDREVHDDDEQVAQFVPRDGEHDERGDQEDQAGHVQHERRRVQDFLLGSAGEHVAGAAEPGRQARAGQEVPEPPDRPSAAAGRPGGGHARGAREEPVDRRQRPCDHVPQRAEVEEDAADEQDERGARDRTRDQRE